MVLHDGENHLVAFVQKGFGKRRGDEIEALGGAAGENNLGRGTRIEEGAHALTGGLVQGGGFLREGVNAAVHIGVARGVEAVHGLQHGAGFLRRGGIVEIHQRATVHLTAQQGEIRAKIGHQLRLFSGSKLHAAIGASVGAVALFAAKTTFDQI